MPYTPPPLVVLGIAERASYVRDGNTNLSKWNILGLKHTLVSHIFPLSLSGWHLGIAIRSGALSEPTTIRWLDESGFEVATIQIGTVPAEASESRALGRPLQVPRTGWTTAFLSLDVNIPIVVQKPGTYSLVTTGPDGENYPVGELQLVVVDPLPLTSERIAAIRSDPHAIKAVRATLGCRECSSSLTIYAALDRESTKGKGDAVWYSDLPDTFSCDCGKSVHDLSILRRNFFGLLGGSSATGGKDLSYLPLYEKSALETLLEDFRAVLDDDPLEERLQIFLQDHPVLLHQFPSQQLFFKPAILTFFKADFAIVTPQKELVLIEIERASTRLLKRDGGEAAGLGHAFDQVEDWLHKVDEHRLAVLDSLGIERASVGSVRGVVIAGRDAGYDASHLRKAKGRDRGRVTFLTFDDVAHGLAALVEQLASI